eukprot:SAG25_NODE_46_length_19040_cov_20.665699_22_plen_119_part_00
MAASPASSRAIYSSWGSGVLSHRYATRRHAAPAATATPADLPPALPGPGGTAWGGRGVQIRYLQNRPNPPKKGAWVQRWLCARIRRAAFADRTIVGAEASAEVENESQHRSEPRYSKF